MDSAQRFFQKTIKYSFFVFLFELLLIIIFIKNPSTYIYGLILGYVVNIVFFRVMYLNARSKVEMSVKGAKWYSIFNYGVRFVLTGLVFYIAIASKNLSLLTCFIGFFNIKIAIYVNAIFDFFRSKKV